MTAYPGWQLLQITCLPLGVAHGAATLKETELQLSHPCGLSQTLTNAPPPNLPS